MVLCLGMCWKIPSHLFQKCGKKNWTRLLDVNTLSRTLEGSVCDSLIGLHAFICYVPLVHSLIVGR